MSAKENKSSPSRLPMHDRKRGLTVEASAHQKDYEIQIIIPTNSRKKKESRNPDVLVVPRNQDRTKRRLSHSQHATERLKEMDESSDMSKELMFANKQISNKEKKIVDLKIGLSNALERINDLLEANNSLRAMAEMLTSQNEELSSLNVQLLNQVPAPAESSVDTGIGNDAVVYVDIPTEDFKQWASDSEDERNIERCQELEENIACYEKIDQRCREMQRDLNADLKAEEEEEEEGVDAKYDSILEIIKEQSLPGEIKLDVGYKEINLKLEEQLQEMDLKNKALDEVISKQEQRLKEEERENCKLKEEIATMMNCSDLEKNVLKKRIRELEKETNSMIEKRIEELEKENAVLKEQIQGIQEFVDSKSTMSDSKCSEDILSNLKRQISRSKQNEDRLHEMIFHLEEEKSNLTLVVSEMEEANSDLEHSMFDLRKDFQQSKVTISKWEKENELLTQKVTELENIIQFLEAEKIALLEERDHMKVEMDKKSERDTTGENLEHLIEVVLQLQAEKENLKKELNRKEGAEQLSKHQLKVKKELTEIVTSLQSEIEYVQTMDEKELKLEIQAMKKIKKLLTDLQSEKESDLNESVCRMDKATMTKEIKQMIYEHDQEYTSVKGQGNVRLDDIMISDIQTEEGLIAVTDSKNCNGNSSKLVNCVKMAELKRSIDGHNEGYKNIGQGWDVDQGGMLRNDRDEVFERYEILDHFSGDYDEHWPVLRCRNDEMDGQLASESSEEETMFEETLNKTFERHDSVDVDYEGDTETGSEHLFGSEERKKEVDMFRDGAGVVLEKHSESGMRGSVGYKVDAEPQQQQGICDGRYDHEIRCLGQGIPVERLKNTKEEIQQVWKDREYLPGRWVSTFEKLRDEERESNTCSEVEFDGPLFRCNEEMNEEYRSDGDTTEIEEMLEGEEGTGSEETELEDDRSDDTDKEEALDGATDVTSEEQLNLVKEDGSECEQVVELESELGYIEQEESCIKVKRELGERSAEIPDGGVEMEYREENDLEECIDVREWRQESNCDANVEKDVVQGLEKCDTAPERNERDGQKELERNQRDNHIEIEDDLDGEMCMEKCGKNDTDIFTILEEDQLKSNETDSYTEIKDINEEESSESERGWESEEQGEGLREEQDIRDGPTEKGRLECKQIWERDLDSEQELKKDVSYCMGMKECEGEMLAIDGDWTWSDQMLQLGNELKDEEGFSEMNKSDEELGVTNLEDEEELELSGNVEQGNKFDIGRKVEKVEEPDVRANVEEDKEPDFDGSEEEDKEPDVCGNVEEDKEPDVGGNVEEDKEPDVGGDVEEDEEPDVGGNVEEDKEPDVGGNVEEDEKPDVGANVEEDEEPDVGGNVEEDEESDFGRNVEEVEEPDVGGNVEEDKEPDVGGNVEEDEEPDVGGNVEEDEESDFDGNEEEDEEPDVEDEEFNDIFSENQKVWKTELNEKPSNKCLTETEKEKDCIYGDCSEEFHKQHKQECGLILSEKELEEMSVKDQWKEQKELEKQPKEEIEKLDKNQREHLSKAERYVEIEEEWFGEMTMEIENLEFREFQILEQKREVENRPKVLEGNVSQDVEKYKVDQDVENWEQGDGKTYNVEDMMHLLSEEQGEIDEEKREPVIEDKKTEIESVYEENDQREMNEYKTKNSIEGVSDHNELEEEIRTQELGGMSDDLEMELELNDYCQERNLSEKHRKIKQNADEYITTELEVGEDCDINRIEMVGDEEEKIKDEDGESSNSEIVEDIEEEEEEWREKEQMNELGDHENEEEKSDPEEFMLHGEDYNNVSGQDFELKMKSDKLNEEYGWKSEEGEEWGMKEELEQREQLGMHEEQPEMPEEQQEEHHEEQHDEQHKEQQEQHEEQKKQQEEREEQQGYEEVEEHEEQMERPEKNQEIEVEQPEKQVEQQENVCWNLLEEEEFEQKENQKVHLRKEQEEQMEKAEEYLKEPEEIMEDQVHLEEVVRGKDPAMKEGIMDLDGKESGMDSKQHETNHEEGENCALFNVNNCEEENDGCDSLHDQIVSPESYGNRRNDPAIQNCLSAERRTSVTGCEKSATEDIDDIVEDGGYGLVGCEGPYCCICETYGHWPSECNDDVTF